MVIEMSGYEAYFIKLLKRENIDFVREKTYEDLAQGRFRFDFYLIDYKILIEVDGE